MGNGLCTLYTRESQGFLCPLIGSLNQTGRRDPKGLVFLFMTLALSSLIGSFNLEDGNASSLEEVKEEYARMYSEDDR